MTLPLVAPGTAFFAAAVDDSPGSSTAFAGGIVGCCSRAYSGSIVGIAASIALDVYQEHCGLKTCKYPIADVVVASFDVLCLPVTAMETN